MEPHPPVPRGVAHAPGRLPRAGGGYDAGRAEDWLRLRGAIDGVFGPVTETVVGQYQTNAGLPATGVVEERTWMAPAGAAGATLESLSGLVL
jgi:peptidoglycan hydrolase-like protein with peptidoglycan-binding domain